MQESGEMYLETIYVLSQKSNNVRSSDVADYMNYSRPSVSRAIGILKKGGYIEMDEDGALKLTPSGKEIAEKMYERHIVISKALMFLGIDEETAIEDACKIEHDISDKSFEAIKKHMKLTK